MELNEVKIESGKITTLVCERGNGMSTLLCSYIFNALNEGKKVLLLSWNLNSAMATSKMLVNNHCDNEKPANLHIASINSLNNKLISERFDLIIFDAPNIFLTDWDRVMSTFKTACLSGSACVIGITWENIDKDLDAMFEIKRCCNLSDYGYFLNILGGTACWIKDDELQ